MNSVSGPKKISQSRNGTSKATELGVPNCRISEKSIRDIRPNSGSLK